MFCHAILNIIRYGALQCLVIEKYFVTLKQLVVLSIILFLSNIFLYSAYMLESNYY